MKNTIRQLIDAILNLSLRTDLDVETCRERLTDEYREKLSNERKDFLYQEKRWLLTIEESLGDTIRIYVRGPIIGYSFRTTLLEIEDGTSISCKHNPLREFMFWFLLSPLFLLIPFPFLPDDYWEMGFAFFLFFAAPFLAFFSLQSGTARKCVFDYLDVVLDVELVDS